MPQDYRRDGQYYLGVLYANGKGVVQNDVKAREWFEKAAANGNTDAKARLMPGAVLHDEEADRQSPCGCLSRMEKRCLRSSKI